MQKQRHNGLKDDQPFPHDADRYNTKMAMCVHLSFLDNLEFFYLLRWTKPIKTEKAEHWDFR